MNADENQMNADCLTKSSAFICLYLRSSAFRSWLTDR